MRKIYTVGGSYGYSGWMQGKTINSLEDADLVVFTGGEDINPELYKRGRHFSTHFNRVRDDYEVRKFNEAKELGKKLIGICRGAQLFCAMAGGILVQDSRHPFIHEVKTKDNKKIFTTSAHHQRQYPFISTTGKPVNFELIGWSENLSPYSYGESDKDRLLEQPEVEIAIYPDINALAIQGHPEWAHGYQVQRKWEKQFIRYCRNLLDEFMETKYGESK